MSVFIFRGKDHLYFQTAQKDNGKQESQENLMPITNSTQNRLTSMNPSTQEPGGESANAILSGVFLLYLCISFT